MEPAILKLPGKPLARTLVREGALSQTSPDGWHEVVIPSTFDHEVAVFE